MLATPLRAETPSPDVDKTWYFRARVGGGYFDSSRWSAYDGPNLQTVYGGVGCLEVAGGVRAVDWAAVSLSGALCLDPAPGYDPHRESPGESRTVVWGLVGPSVTLLLDRLVDVPLRLDGTVGVARLDHDLDYYFDGDPSDHHVWRVGTWGLGYAVALALVFPVAAWDIGPFIQWRATAVGDLIRGGEGAAGWKTTMLGGGFQVAY